MAYCAFISYCHADERHARWLHTWLERYRVPKKFVGTISEQHAVERPARLKPIYRDGDEASAGQGLKDHIRAALADSRNLIVICSPHAVRSGWVDDEIRHFQSLGRGDRVFCLIVDGDPNAADGPTQCMPQALRPQHDETRFDALAADMRPGRDKARIAALRIVSGLLDMRFDELRQREQERRVRVLSLITAGAVSLSAAMVLLAVVAFQQKTKADLGEREAVMAKDQAEQRRLEAVEARDQEAQQRRKANDARIEAIERQKDAESANAAAQAARALAEQRRRETRVQFEDATLQRLALQSKAMLSGERAGGALMAARVALAGLAIKPRADQLATLQAAQNDASIRAWEVPAGSISAIALSPDGGLVVTASGNALSRYRLRFWNVQEPNIGMPVGADIQLENYVTSLAFSPDGRRVIAADSDGLINQWDLASRRAVAPAVSQLKGTWLRRIAISPTGDRWLTGAADNNNLVLWTTTAGGYEPRRLAGATGGVPGVAFSPDGTLVAAGGEDRAIRLWNSSTGQPRGTVVDAHEGRVTSLAFSPDGRFIASSGHDKTVRLWRVGPGGLTLQLRIDDAGNGLDHLAYSPDGLRVAAAAQDGYVRVWDARTGKALGVPLVGHRGTVRSVSFTPDGNRIVSGGFDGTVRIWDGHGAVNSAVALGGIDLGVVGMSFAPGAGDHRLAAVGIDGTLRQWDTGTGQAVGTLIQVPRHVGFNAVTYSADGRRLLTVSGDNVIRVWDAESGRAVLPLLRGPIARGSAVATSRDGKLVASATDGGHVTVWHADTGREAHRLGPLRDQVWSVGFSPDGQRLAASGAKGLFVLWQLPTGQPVYEAPEAANSALPSLAFSPDGRYIATANRQRNTLNLWDARTGRPIARPFLGHDLSVNAVAFSHDSRFIAGSGGDLNVRLWDAESGEPVGAPIPTGVMASAVAFSADGQRLAYGITKHAIQVQDGPAAWARLLCRRLTRNMSRDEWKQYVGKGWDYVAQCPGLPGP